MGTLKILFILIVCLFTLNVNGQTADTSKWNVYLFEKDTTIVKETDVVIHSNGTIEYKEKDKFIFREKDFALSREKLSVKTMLEYRKGIE